MIPSISWLPHGSLPIEPGWYWYDFGVPRTEYGAGVIIVQIRNVDAGQPLLPPRLRQRYYSPGQWDNPGRWIDEDLKAVAEYPGFLKRHHRWAGPLPEPPL